MQKRGSVVLILEVLIVLSILSIIFVLNANYSKAFNCPDPCGQNEIQWPDCGCHATTYTGSDDVYSQCIQIFPQECCGSPGQDNSAARDSQACKDALGLNDNQAVFPDTGGDKFPYTSKNGKKSFRFALAADYYDTIMDGLKAGTLSIDDVWSNNGTLTALRNEWFKKSGDYIDEICYVPACGPGQHSAYEDCAVEAHCDQISSQLGGEWDNTARDYAAADWDARLTSPTTPSQNTKALTNPTPPTPPEVKFNVPLASIHFSVESKNISNSELYGELHAAFAGKKPELTNEVAGFLKYYKASINVQANETISVDLPAGPIQNVIAVSNRKLTSATMAITGIDEVNLSKSVPLLGGKGLIGNPVYPVPELPLGISSSKYDIQYIFKIENKMPNDEGSIPYYKEAFFNFVLGVKSDADARKVKLLHYDETNKRWIPLLTQYYSTHDAYGRYRFSAHASSFSYFAIVIEKNTYSLTWLWVLLVIIILIIASFFYFVIKISKKNSKVTMIIKSCLSFVKKIFKSDSKVMIAINSFMSSVKRLFKNLLKKKRKK